MSARNIPGTQLPKPSQKRLNNDIFVPKQQSNTLAYTSIEP